MEDRMQLNAVVDAVLSLMEHKSSMILIKTLTEMKKKDRLNLLDRLGLLVGEESLTYLLFEVFVTFVNRMDRTKEVK